METGLFRVISKPIKFKFCVILCTGECSVYELELSLDSVVVTCCLNELISTAGSSSRKKNLRRNYVQVGSHLQYDTSL